MLSSSPNISFETLVSDSKPSVTWSELTDFEDKSLTKELYLSAQQFFFHSNELLRYKLNCILKTNNDQLLVATNRGQIGILNRDNLDEAKWIAVSRIYSFDFETNDQLYDENRKELVYFCIDNKNQLCLLTKLYLEEFRYNQFTIEIYFFDELNYDIKLVNIFSVSQLLSKQLLHDESFEFVNIQYDFDLNLFVLIDQMNHKIYWCNPNNFHAKKSISSSDSIFKPNSIAIIKHFGFYLTSEKGVVLRRSKQEAVLHEIPADLSPTDIFFSDDDKTVYFIDDFNLYRTRLADNNDKQLRYKRLFSNHASLDNLNGFSRVIKIKDYFYLLVKDGNCIILLNAKDLLYLSYE